MNRKAFLLGLYSIGSQVLLLREIVSSLNGDELFIGTALFGWLLSVALGAASARKLKVLKGANSLFIAGIIFLPLSIIAIRLSPLIAVGTAGQIISFSTAALISILLMFPVGVISGRLFTVIASEGYRPSESMVQAYLFEGIGAFLGGLMVTMLVGNFLSTLPMAVFLAIVVLTINFYSFNLKRPLRPFLLFLLAAVIARYAVSPLDLYIDRIKYRPYEVTDSFDTPYSHQVILSRDGTITLITDNTVEATYPDLMTTENILIPPLLYGSDSANILYIGRPEFGIMQLADSLPRIKISSVDPRKLVSERLDERIKFSGKILRIDDDPVAFVAKGSNLSRYDIIIVDAGDPDNYKSGRLLTEEFFKMLRLVLNENGLIAFPSHYDTDRQISGRKKLILAIVYNTFSVPFNNVTAWPGEMTLFFASDKTFESPAGGNINTTIKVLGYSPQYINDAYLPDRLQEGKMARLAEVRQTSPAVNSINKPSLIYEQAIYRAKAGSIDKALLPFLYENHYWIFAFPLGIILLFFFTSFSKSSNRRFGLFIYFMAGLISLSLELIAFYLYQSSAGSLYSELGMLIGVFMLGLSLGTYISSRADPQRLEIPSLALLLISVIFFIISYNKVSPHALLFYYLFFLFTTALATAGLFVGATHRYYYGRPGSNRGLGYALEIIGSSIGALVPVTILLPVIGLTWILVSLVILLVLAMVGAIIKT